MEQQVHIVQEIQSIIDRYLHPDQVLFGHLMNPKIKISYQYQLSKSTAQQEQNDQLIIYQKKISQIKIQSMIQMMRGNNQPLFKSSITNNSITNNTSKYNNSNKYNNSTNSKQHMHLQQHQKSDGSYQYQEEDDYQDYDQQMYLYQNQFENQFQEEYDQQKNPIMAFGQSLRGILPHSHYAKQYLVNPTYSNLQPNNHSIQSNINSKLYKSQHNPITNKSQRGLGQILNVNADKKINKNIKTMNINKNIHKKQQKNKQQNNSDQDWQTQSQQEVQGQQTKPNKP